MASFSSCSSSATTANAGIFLEEEETNKQKKTVDRYNRQKKKERSKQGRGAGEPHSQAPKRRTRPGISDVGGKKLGLGLGLGFGALGVVPVCLFAILHPFVLSPAIGRRGGETRRELRWVGFMNFRKSLS